MKPSCLMAAFFVLAAGYANAQSNFPIIQTHAAAPNATVDTGLSGWHFRRDCCNGTEKKKGAKTLFSWEICKEEDEKDKKDDEDGEDKKDNGKEKDKNGNGKNGNGKEKDKNGKDKNGNGKDKNGKGEEEEKEDEIVTDRPDFTESSTNVGRGRVQIEMGYTYSRNLDQGVHDSHSFPEMLIRIGMFADWFELRIGQNFSNTRSFGLDGGPFAVSNGGEDTYLGVGLALTEQKKILPESRILLQTTLPTGSGSVTSGKVLPGMNLLYGWEINDFLSMAGSSQGNAAVDDEGRSYLELAQSFTIGYSLSKKLGAYTEWFAFFPYGATAPDTGPQYYFNGGFTYKFTPTFQYDIRAGVGLNRQADDFFIGSGFAVKF